MDQYDGEFVRTFQLTAYRVTEGFEYQLRWITHQVLQVNTDLVYGVAVLEQVRQDLRLGLEGLVPPSRGRQQ